MHDTHALNKRAVTKMSIADINPMTIRLLISNFPSANQTNGCNSRTATPSVAVHPPAQKHVTGPYCREETRENLSLSLPWLSDV